MIQKKKRGVIMKKLIIAGLLSSSILLGTEFELADWVKQAPTYNPKLHADNVSKDDLLNHIYEQEKIIKQLKKENETYKLVLYRFKFILEGLKWYHKVINAQTAYTRPKVSIK